MRRLVALDIPPSDAFVVTLRRCHDAGDAVLPLDGRLSPSARQRLLDELRPAAVVEESGHERRLQGAMAVEDGDALVVATSGSTGTPKGVVLTHDAIAASARASNERLGVDASTDRWLSCLPLAHIGGLSVVLRALFAGVPLEVHDRFEREAVVEAAAKRGATLVSLVPTTLSRLPGDVARFRTVVLGGSAPLGRLPGNVVSTYGMTETGSGVVYDGFPLGGVEVRLDEAGEILVRGPMLLRAYRDGRDPKQADGWLPTGDVGELGPDGRLRVHGRRGELVVTGGENVWPAAVEAVLSSLPGIADVAVGGVSDPEWGERVVAYVVAAEGAHVRLEDLREPVRDELGPWAAPKELVFVDALPRTALGKIKRPELARLATGEVDR